MLGFGASPCNMYLDVFVSAVGASEEDFESFVKVFEFQRWPSGHLKRTRSPLLAISGVIFSPTRSVSRGELLTTWPDGHDEARSLLYPAGAHKSLGKRYLTDASYPAARHCVNLTTK